MKEVFYYNERGVLIMSWNEFEGLIWDNLNNVNIHDFLIRFIGYDYVEAGEALDDCISSTWDQMPEDELKKFEKELLEIIA